jgi:hypothetical protein
VGGLCLWRPVIDKEHRLKDLSENRLLATGGRLRRGRLASWDVVHHGGQAGGSWTWQARAAAPGLEVGGRLPGLVGGVWVVGLASWDAGRLQ